MLDAAVGKGLFGGVVARRGVAGSASGVEAGGEGVAGSVCGCVGSRTASFLPTFEAEFAPLLQFRTESVRRTIRELEDRLHEKLVAQGKGGLGGVATGGSSGAGTDPGTAADQPHGGVGKDGTGIGPTIVIVETGTTMCTHEWSRSGQATLIWDRFAAHHAYHHDANVLIYSVDLDPHQMWHTFNPITSNKVRMPCL